MTAILYAAKGALQTASDLYTVNTTTGAVTSLGASGFALTGLAVDPSDNTTLYGATSPNSTANPKSLVTLNTTTGAGTLVGAFTSGHPIPDICFDSTGQLYGWDNNTKRLVLINKATGGLTQTAASAPGFSPAGNGIDCDSDDVLYSCLDGSGGTLRTINRTTGALTDIAALDDSAITGHNTVSACSFDPDGALWGLVITGPSQLVTINLSTGVMTLKCALATAGDWDAMAWSRPFVGPPPAPEGVCIAFSATALTADPTWVRLDI